MKTYQEIWDELRQIYGEGLMKNFTTTPSTIGEFTAVAFSIGHGLEHGLDVLLTCGQEYALVSPYEARGSDFGRGQIFLEQMTKIFGFAPYCKFYNFTGRNREMFVFIEKNHDKHFEFFRKNDRLCLGLEKI
jgi:hypothetical protein